MTKNQDIGVELIKSKLAALPNKPGVYRMIGEDGKILYVGKAKNLKKRVYSYSKFKDLPNRLKRMVSETHKLEIVNTDSEIEALILELNFIKTLRPKYNIMLTDDKTYPYIYFNDNHSYPGIYKYRGQPKGKGKFFGPYVGSYDVDKTIELLKKSFLIRSCSDSEFANRSRPCLEYQIKRCTAPCVSYITKNNYKKNLHDAYNFLRGKNKIIREKLTSAMENASKNQNYEEAAEIRDRIQAITAITSKQETTDSSLIDCDFFAIYKESNIIIIEQFIFRNGFNQGNQHFFPKNIEGLEESEILKEFIKQYYNPTNLVKEIYLNKIINNKEEIIKLWDQQYELKTRIITPKSGKKEKIMKFVEKNAKFHLRNKLTSKTNNLKYHKKLAEIFNLGTTPNKIEVFDNSHISGSEAIGAMIVSDLNGFNKKLYRKFNIKTASSNDDYDMMREVLTRRYKKMLETDPNNEHDSWPDLILIDGGKGQASIAAEIFSQLNINIDFYCIAKDGKRNKGFDKFCNNFTDYFNIEDKDTHYYLQRIRDEAHRFVIKSHRQKRNQKLTKSQLDNIPGIGKAKKEALLKFFGSVANIRSQAEKDLIRAPGINKELAKNIINYLQN
ncbi:MAG: excinuclease ABC subunit UvrC [Rickettsiales bacterium]|nr:excinuclease ABC subunit UvrC [Rickettsiales bacterium]